MPWAADIGICESIPKASFGSAWVKLNLVLFIFLFFLPNLDKSGCFFEPTKKKPVSRVLFSYSTSSRPPPLLRHRPAHPDHKHIQLLCGAPQALKGKKGKLTAGPKYTSLRFLICEFTASFKTEKKDLESYIKYWQITTDPQAKHSFTPTKTGHRNRKITNKGYP